MLILDAFSFPVNRKMLGGEHAAVARSLLCRPEFLLVGTKAGSPFPMPLDRLRSPQKLYAVFSLPPLTLGERSLTFIADSRWRRRYFSGRAPDRKGKTLTVEIDSRYEAV